MTTSSRFPTTSRLLCVASTIALTVGNASAQGTAAASPPVAEAEEIVVTGFRNSLVKALDAKRKSGVAVDVILAEDIGKFPDLNLSESIQRIPGVSLARDGGEGRQIAVRGLGAQFTRVRINGMEALASTGSSDASGGANRSRAFDFNVFASDLFSSIKVSKSAEAAQEEGSLGATVDLQAGRPFDQPGFKLALSGQDSYNTLAKKAGPRLAGLISDTFLDDTVGILISGAYSERSTIEEGSSTVRWGTNVGNFAPGFQSAPAAGPTLAQLNGAFHPRFPRYDRYENEGKRLGLTGSLQWKPSDSTLISLDALYARFKATRREYYLEAPSFSTGSACTTANRPTNCGLADFDVVSATVDANNVLVKGVFNDVDIRTENRFDRLDTKFTQYTLSGSHDFSDALSVNINVGTSKSDFQNPVQTTLTFDQFNVQGYSYDFTDSRHPALSYGSANLTSSAGWVLRELRERQLSAKNTYDSADLSLKYEVSDAFTLRAGGNYKKYGFVTTELRRVDAAGSTANVEVFTAAQIATLNAFAPLSSYSTIATLNGSGLGIPSGTPTSWLVPDLDKAYALFNINDQTAFNGLFKLGTAPALTNNYAVQEKDKSGFAQVDFKFDALGMPVRGNVGVRYVETRQQSTGYAYLGGVVTPIIANRSYSDTLPSFNVALEPVDDLLVRFAAAKAMTRPGLGQLSPGSAFNVAGSTRAVTAGNPNLDPIRSTNFDLSAEWYFQPGSLMSVALFHKNLSSFVQTVTTNTTFGNNPFGLPDSAAVTACGNQTTDCNTTTTTWSFNVPINTPGGNLNGFEINFQQGFKFLPGFLGNTGALLNYTYVKAPVNYVNAQRVTVSRQNLTNLSPKAYNATLYYEDRVFSARVSAAYRSRYLTAVPGADNTAATPILFQGTNSTLNVDASVQWTISKHFKVSIEGINLTDQFQDQFIGTQDLLSVYHHTGREILIGARYTF